jgi:hypothetical protein
MGNRTIKRVTLSFDAPLNKVWQGYIMPPELYLPKCPDCVYAFWDSNSTGYNRETALLWASFYGTVHLNDAEREVVECWHSQITQDEVQALVDRGRLVNFRTAQPDGVPTADEVNEWDRTARGIDGHDGTNAWILLQTRAERTGVWGFCASCDGNCTLGTEQQIEAYKSWKPTQPPRGRGWQLWETVSEGSPVSPVFRTSEDLAHWCVDNADLFAGMRADLATWLRLVSSKSEMEFGSNSIIDSSGNIRAMASLS